MAYGGGYITLEERAMLDRLIEKEAKEKKEEERQERLKEIAEVVSIVMGVRSEPEEAESRKRNREDEVIIELRKKIESKKEGRKRALIK